MQFEAKHRFSKELASTIRNFKNICKSIADRTQITLAHSLLNNKLFTSEHVVVNSTSVLLSTLEPDLCACISNQVGVGYSDELNIVNSVLIGHYYFKSGCCVVLKTEEGCPVFGKVIATTVCIICEELKTLAFVDQFHAYHVESSGNLVAHQSHSLKDYHPLCMHKIDSGGVLISVIAVRYKII
jgi:hypothetical protein